MLEKDRQGGSNLLKVFIEAGTGSSERSYQISRSLSSERYPSSLPCLVPGPEATPSQAGREAWPSLGLPKAEEKERTCRPRSTSLDGLGTLALKQGPARDGYVH